MAEQADRHERTEAPTPRRRQQAGEKGNLLRSQELTAAATLAGTALLLHIAGPTWWRVLMDMVEARLAAMGAVIDLPAADIVQLGRDAVLWLLVLVSPFAATVIVFSVAAQLPGGIVLNADRIVPKLERLSPRTSVANIFGLRGVGRLVSMSVKAAAIAAIAWASLDESLGGLLESARYDAGLTFAGVIPIAGDILARSAVALLALSLGDLGLAWYLRERDLRMTRKEVKDEMKREEGDPELKGRIRRVQREQAQRRMAQEVPKADVVVTNPTHLAVALCYDPLRMAAPEVVARGADLLAQHLKRIAREAGVPIVEDKPLARALYRTCRERQPIPPELYKAVALVLAHVMRLRRRRR